MLPPRSGLRFWLYRKPTDMRKSFDGLAALVRHALGEAPLDGALYSFVNRRRTIIKVLYFEGDVYCVWSKRLAVPSAAAAGAVRRDGRARCSGDGSDLKGCVSSQYVEVRIHMEYWDISANGDRGDQAVDELAYGMSPLPARSVERCRSIVVHGFSR